MIWGKTILKAEVKYFQGAEEFSFMDLERSMHYFQGTHTPPTPSGGGGGGVSTYNDIETIGHYLLRMNLDEKLQKR